MCDETKFSVMCSLFNWTQKTKSTAKKRSKFRKFLDTFCARDDGDCFGAVRLILPALDRQRASYGLRESVLAACLVDALGMSRHSDDARRLFNWRKGGPATGLNAGNFALVATEVLQIRQGSTSGGLTIKELNELLDRLASSENRAEKISVLSDLIKKTSAQEMKWIIMIILKDLKLGISERSIFHEYHPDAEDLFNVTCDLKLVCEKLRERNQRHKRQDIEVGKPVRPQLALRVGNADTAWKKFHGKEVVVECKFDGDRIQIHKNGQEIHFFSRNFLDHPEYGHSMSDVIMQNVLVDRCILDGEMLVWDATTNRFAEFGSNQEIAKIAKEGLDTDKQLCYVAFDILYLGDTSVIHQSLKERQELLRKVVMPIKGRLEILVPSGCCDDHGPPGEPCWSITAYNVDDVERFFKKTVENRDEGIVLKDRGSKWEPGDRSGKWLKLKPEYIQAGSDLDVLIIGGYYGSGRRGGEVAQFLVGLAERSSPNTFPSRFISFCRVGTGLSDEELDAVVTMLKPFFRRNEHPKKAPPSFYAVTNNSKERPDVWIDKPEKSIILSITSDIRTIRSEVFAAPYSLRHPRIDRVRYDKPWHECLDVQSFVELVESSNGTTKKGADSGELRNNRPRGMKLSRKGEKKTVSAVPPHFIQTDVSNITEVTLIFSGMVFYFVNMPPTYSLDSLHKIVVENGGTFSMNLNNSVTHCIASECKGIKFEAAKLHGDIIHYSWLLDCHSQKKLLKLPPKYFLFLSDTSRKKLQQELDENLDPYYSDLDIEDLKQHLSTISSSKDSKTIDYYEGKYCPRDEWSCFRGCCIYLHSLSQALNSESKVLDKLAARRMKLEISMGGGKVSKSVSQATHFVVISPLGFNINFSTILRGLSPSEVHVLCKRTLHVVGSQWLEDCFNKGQKLQEERYSLKPTSLEDSRKHDPSPCNLSSMDNVERQNVSSSPTKDGKQKKGKASSRIASSSWKDETRERGRPTIARGRKRKVSVIQPQRQWGHTRKSATVHEKESDVNPSSKKNGIAEEREIEKGDNRSQTAEGYCSLKETQVANPHDVGEDSEQGESVGKALGIESASGCEVHDSKKLEVMVAPAQSILINMIRSIGTMKADSIDAAVAEGKLPEDTKRRRYEEDKEGQLQRDRR